MKKVHTKSESYKLQNKRKRENSIAKSAFLVQSTCPFYSREILVVTKCESNASKEYILDCACTFHTCFIREVLSLLSPSTVSIVLIGNNSPCKIEGMGKVSINMFHGKVLTLRNVNYVTKLKRNLISLDILEPRGYKFSRGGILEVCKGSLVVIKGHQKLANLYVFEGSTIMGDVGMLAHYILEKILLNFGLNN